MAVDVVRYRDHRPKSPAENLNCSRSENCYLASEIKKDGTK
jgi:hypothetical protein